MRVVACCLAAALAAGSLPAQIPGADAPASPGAGWIDLMTPDVWKKVDPGWIVTDRVTLDPEKANRLKAEKKDGGAVWVNGDKGRLPDLYTKQTFGDCEVHVEFVLAKNSNSGVKLQGVYEVQFLDSYGKKDLSGDSMGGIYPRAELTPNYRHIDKGIAPRVNAAKPAGEWNVLDLVWKAPRVDGDGKKTANAVLVRAVLNGQLIHENQDVPTPTGHNYKNKETPTGPLMLQADHGPVAFRAVRIKPVK